jgi:hypothetical protein
MDSEHVLLAVSVLNQPRKGGRMMRKLVLYSVSLLVVVTMLAACGATPAPQVIEKQVPVEVTRVVVETQVVQGAPVEVTKIVKEEVTQQVVVTATPEPVVKEEAPDVLGTFPRSETLIARILTGRGRSLVSRPGRRRGAGRRSLWRL